MKKQTSLKQNEQPFLQNQQISMQNKRSPIPNQQSCTELTLYVGGVQRGIRSRSLEKTYTEENVSKLFMKEVLFINFEIIIIF